MRIFVGESNVNEIKITENCDLIIMTNKIESGSTNCNRNGGRRISKIRMRDGDERSTFEEGGKVMRASNRDRNDVLSNIW